MKIRLLLPDPHAFDAQKLFLDDEEYRITKLQWHDARNANLRLAGVQSRKAAEALKGKAVSLDPAWFDQSMGRPLASYLGLMAVNDETDEEIDVVTEVAHNGAQVILVIGTAPAEHLVPVVDDFIVGINTEQIRIRPIPGLLE